MIVMSVSVSGVAGVLALAFFLALVVERVIQFVVKPLIESLARAAGWDVERVGLVIPYLAALMGAGVAWGFGLDLFAGLAEVAGLTPAAWFTRGLTAVVVAGGSNLLHDLWPQGIEIEETIYIEETPEARRE